MFIIFLGNPSHLVKWLTQFFRESSDPVEDVKRSELWTTMKNYFCLEEGDKSDYFNSLYTALSILKWNTKTLKVRGKKVITGITSKKPLIYFTSHVDTKQVTVNTNILFLSSLKM